MTRAPENLMAVRSLLLDHLGKHGLSPVEVGIVGDTAHARQGNSYHLGLPEQARTGYAATESPRDKAGLSEYASALDIGSFSVRVAGKAHNLRSFSVWLVAQCKANTADTRDIREIIYSPDGKVVRRWDREGRRSSGDDSHLWHTHISFYRDATKAGRDQTPLFRRYLRSIGLIEGDDDMDRAEFLAHFRAAIADDSIVRSLRAIPWQYVGGGIPEGFSTLKVLNDTYGLAAQAARAAGVDVDESAIVRGVLAGLTPEKIAGAIPAAMAQQVVDELTRRLAS